MVGEPADLEVANFDWDEENVDHIAGHGIKPDDIEAALNNSPLFFQNLPGRSATHIMIGRDARGRVLFVPIIGLEAPAVWRVISAWESRFARRLYAGD